MKIWNKKLFNKFWFFYQSQFELKGLYISYRFLKKKKKVVQEPTPVKYLKTTWYVIPLPSEEDPSTKSKKKKSISSNIDLVAYKIYNHYELIFVRNWGMFIVPMTITYEPDKLSHVQKFDYAIWFIILWVLHSVVRFFAENSFPWFHMNSYYSLKNLKFFSGILFWWMFTIYINPNLPLRWKIGENFVPKQQGTALQLIKQFIFRQMFFESLGLYLNFQLDEKKIFWQALLDPEDKTYHWPTRWLYLLGLSEHDGKISGENEYYFWSFSHIPTRDVKPHLFFYCKKLIVAQLLYWKEIFIELAKQNKLIFDPGKANHFSLKRFTLSEFSNLNFLDLINPFLKNFAQRKILLNSCAKVTNFPIPTHYVGTKLTFFKKKYLIYSSFDASVDPLQLLSESNPEIFLKKFIFYSANSTKNKLCMFEQSFFNSKLSLQDYMEIKEKTLLFSDFEWFSPQNIIQFMYENIEKTDDYTRIIKNEKIKPKNQSVEQQEMILPIPHILKNLFFLLVQQEISFDDLNSIFILEFLKVLPLFLHYQKIANIEVENFLAPIAVYKKYLELQEKYNLSSATMAYNVLKEQLKPLANKDRILEWTEPFGLNPFRTISEILTKKDVPFPEAVTLSTFTAMIKKKILKDNKFFSESSNSDYNFIVQFLSIFFFNNFFLIVSQVSTINFFFLIFQLKLFFFCTKKQSWQIFNCIPNFLFNKIKLRVILFVNKNFRNFRNDLYLKKKKVYSVIHQFHDELEEFDISDSWDFLSLNLPKIQNYEDPLVKKRLLEAKLAMWQKFFSKIALQQKTYLATSTMALNLWIISFFRYSHAMNYVNYFYRYWIAQDYSMFSTFYAKPPLLSYTTVYNFVVFDYLQILYMLKHFFLVFWRILIFQLKN